MTADIPPVSPALVLAALVGAFHTCLYVLFRGQLRIHVLPALAAAIAGAWVGHVVGSRLGDPLRLGDFALVAASLGAWAGILAVAGLAALRPAGRPRPAEPGHLEDG
jgi:hypothetical protein